MAAPGFYADPHGRHQVRWWDGSQWTCHVGGRGGVGIDDADGLPPVPMLRSPGLTFVELQPGMIGGALDVLDHNGDRVGTVRRGADGGGGWGGISNSGVVMQVRDITGLVLAVHHAPPGRGHRNVVIDPNGVVIGEYVRPGFLNEITQVILGGRMVGQFASAAADTVVADVDGRAVARLRREVDRSFWNWTQSPPERWHLQIQAAVSWPFYLLLLTAPVESNVRYDRRQAGSSPMYGGI